MDGVSSSVCLRRSEKSHWLLKQWAGGSSIIRSDSFPCRLFDSVVQSSCALASCRFGFRRFRQNMLLRHVDSARRNELTQMLSEREQLLQQLRLEKLQWEEKAAQDSAAQATLAHELRNSESTIKQLNEHNTLLADGCRELERCQEAMEKLEHHNHHLQDAARELQARLAANTECGRRFARFPPSGRPCAALLCENGDSQRMTGNLHPLPCIPNPAMCIGPCSDG